MSSLESSEAIESTEAKHEPRSKPGLKPVSRVALWRARHPEHAAKLNRLHQQRHRLKVKKAAAAIAPPAVDLRSLWTQSVRNNK